LTVYICSFIIICLPESKKTKKSSIRVGVEFQADLEVIKKPPLRTNLEKTSEILLWKPSPTLSENDRINPYFSHCFQRFNAHFFNLILSSS